MPLADYKPEQREIPFSGGSFRVKGLSLTDIAVLVRTHLPDIEAVFELFQSKTVVSWDQLEPVALALVSQMPGLAANLIALASGETDAQKDAERLSASLQIEALVVIAELTFNEVGGVKKSVEMVARLLNLTKTDMSLTKSMVTKPGRSGRTSASAAM